MKKHKVNCTKARSAQSFRLASPSMNQSLLEMREPFAVGISQEVTALEEGGCDLKVLGWSGSWRRWCAWVEAGGAHAAQIIVVANRLLLTSNLHFLVLFVSVLPVNLLEMHRNFAQLLKRLSRQHHFLAVAQIAIEKLLHHIHIVDDERVKSLKISRWIQLRHEIDLIHRLTAFCMLIGFVAAERQFTDISIESVEQKYKSTHHVHSPLMNAHGWNVSNRRSLFWQILLNKSTHSCSSTQFAVWMYSGRSFRTICKEITRNDSHYAPADRKLKIYTKM